MGKLKSCPFCGGTAKPTTRGSVNGLKHRVECENRFTTCPMNMRTHHHYDAADAELAWNIRTVYQEMIKGEHHE